MFKRSSSPAAGSLLALLLLPLASSRATTETRLDWDRARQMLDALPLATGEYGVCLLNLRNARSYFEDGEIGAACYEVRLLLGRLIRHGFVHSRAPRRTKKPTP